MALFLVFIESATAKKALCIYLKPTVNENFVGWTQIRVLREYSISHGYAEAVKVGAGSITKLKTFE